MDDRGMKILYWEITYNQTVLYSILAENESIKILQRIKLTSIHQRYLLGRKYVANVEKLAKLRCESRSLELTLPEGSSCKEMVHDQPVEEHLCCPR